MTTAIEKANEQYLDLYGDALKNFIELDIAPTFETIRGYFSQFDHMEREFRFNGRRIIAKRKFTWRCKGVANTNFLHVSIQNAKGNNGETYREQKDGSFKFCGWCQFN